MVRYPLFFRNASNAKTKTMLLSVEVIEDTVKPKEEIPRNKPEMPATLKLNATESTRASAKSSLPSAKSKLIKQ